MNILKIILAFFVVTISITLFGQNITLEELISLRKKDNVELKEYFTKKWQFSNSSKEKPGYYANDTWVFGKKTSEKLVYSYAKDSENRISFYTNNESIYSKIIEEAVNRGMKKESDTVNDRMSEYYGDFKYVLRAIKRIEESKVTYKISLFEGRDFKVMYNQQPPNVDWYNLPEEINFENIKEPIAGKATSELFKAVVNIDEQFITYMDSIDFDDFEMDFDAAFNDMDTSDIDELDWASLELDSSEYDALEKELENDMKYFDSIINADDSDAVIQELEAEIKLMEEEERYIKNKPAEYLYQTSIKSDVQNVYLMDEPKANSWEICPIPNNYIVFVLDEMKIQKDEKLISGDYFKISYYRKIGYVKKDYLEHPKNPEEKK